MTIPFVQARNYTRTSGRQIDLIVIHDMEAPEGPLTAENVANWFAGSNAPRASAHYCCDSDSTVQSVRDIDVAWHAPGASHNGIGIEHAGYARQTPEEWADAYSRQMLLGQSAPLVRDLCAKYGIPVVYVDREGLLRGERGITTHNEVSQAWHRSTHWDPGPGFPMDDYLAMVLGATPPGTAPTPTPVPVDDGLLRRGDTGAEVSQWQRDLVGAGHSVAVDGDFGPATEAATQALQTEIGVTPDGIVGPKTREALARFLAWVASQQPVADAPPFPLPPGYYFGPKSGPKESVSGYYSHREDLRAWQTQMAARGWRITADGLYGPGTAAVAVSFQRDKGLSDDALIGRVTWSAAWTSPVT